MKIKTKQLLPHKSHGRNQFFRYRHLIGSNHKTKNKKTVFNLQAKKDILTKQIQGFKCYSSGKRALC